MSSGPHHHARPIHLFRRDVGVVVPTGKVLWCPPTTPSSQSQHEVPSILV
jgi:hypothetical protein